MASERDFTTELGRGALSVGWLPVRIPDAGKLERFTDPKPFDLVLYAPDGFAHGIELKQVRKGLSWPVRALAPHQERHLLEVERLGNPGWVIVNYRVRLSEREQKRRNQRILNATFAARVSQVVTARTQDAFTSLPLEWWIANGIELGRLALQDQNGERVDAWDPRPLSGASVETCPPASPLPPSSPPEGPAGPMDPPSPETGRKKPPRPSRSELTLDLFRPLGESA